MVGWGAEFHLGVLAGQGDLEKVVLTGRIQVNQGRQEWWLYKPRSSKDCQQSSSS